MYSYIYADRNLNYFVGCKTREGIERAALDYIRNMAGYGAMPPNATRALQDVFAALEKKNAQAAIDAWNYYARTEQNITIACHVIEPLVIVE